MPLHDDHSRSTVQGRAREGPFLSGFWFRCRWRVAEATGPEALASLASDRLVVYPGLRGV